MLEKLSLNIQMIFSSTISFTVGDAYSMLHIYLCPPSDFLYDIANALRDLVSSNTPTLWQKFHEVYEENPKYQYLSVYSSSERIVAIPILNMWAESEANYPPALSRSKNFM